MRERLAHVVFRGTIREKSADPFVRMLKGIRETRRFKGVLLEISSGGGGAVASYDLYLAVKRLDAVKPVVATIGSLAASGGYMAAIGARTVYAYPDSGVGSIGVIYPFFAVKGLLDKLGIDVDLVHQGRHKDAYQGFRRLTDEERGKMEALTLDGYRSFVALVAEARHRPPAEIEPLATGEIWSGLRAKELRLIDALGDREMALEELERLTRVSARKLVRVVPPQPFLERFLGGLGSSVGQSLGASFRESLEDAALEGRFGGLR
jgi:protease-4